VDAEDVLARTHECYSCGPDVSRFDEAYVFEPTSAAKILICEIDAIGRADQLCVALGEPAPCQIAA
jgi:hypothetical protein